MSGKSENAVLLNVNEIKLEKPKVTEKDHISNDSTKRGVSVWNSHLL